MRSHDKPIKNRVLRVMSALYADLVSKEGLERMKQTLLTRLERLERRTSNDIGIVFEGEGAWIATINSRSREFPSEQSASAYLERLTDTVIIIDI